MKLAGYVISCRNPNLGKSEPSIPQICMTQKSLIRGTSFHFTTSLPIANSLILQLPSIRARSKVGELASSLSVVQHPALLLARLAAEPAEDWVLVGVLAEW